MCPTWDICYQEAGICENAPEGDREAPQCQRQVGKTKSTSSNIQLYRGSTQGTASTFSDSVNRAVASFAISLPVKSIPFACADTASKAFPAMFPDSKIAVFLWEDQGLVHDFGWIRDALQKESYRGGGLARSMLLYPK